jgi:hypothetical protein
VPYSKPNQTIDTEPNVTPTDSASTSDCVLPVAMPGTSTCEQVNCLESTPEKRVNNESVTKTLNSIIQIFTSEMKKVQQRSAENNTARKPRKMPRLKAEKYGEVWTTQEVLLKVKENEERNLEKEAKKQKKINNDDSRSSRPIKENCFLLNLIIGRPRKRLTILNTVTTQTMKIVVKDDGPGLIKHHLAAVTIL